MSKPREFFIIDDKYENGRRALSFKPEGEHNKTIHVIDYAAYAEAIKMLEEMAEAADNIELAIIKDVPYIKGISKLIAAVELYREFKEGIK